MLALLVLALLVPCHTRVRDHAAGNSANRRLIRLLRAAAVVTLLSTGLAIDNSKPVFLSITINNNAHNVQIPLDSSPSGLDLRIKWEAADPGYVAFFLCTDVALLFGQRRRARATCRLECSPPSSPPGPALLSVRRAQVCGSLWP